MVLVRVSPPYPPVSRVRPSMKVLPILFAVFFTAASALAADLASLVPDAPRIPDREFSATELGVAPGLEVPITAALQKAIDHVEAQGGGKLILAPGAYLAGPLRLTSRLDLHLSAGAVIKLLPRERAYPADSSRYASLLSASGASDLRISGPGRIDGQGEAWWRAYRAQELSLRRPQIILLENCERVELSGFTSINPPNTHVALRLCREVAIRGVTLDAPDDSPSREKTTSSSAAAFRPATTTSSSSPTPPGAGLRPSAKTSSSAIAPSVLATACPSAATPAAASAACSRSASPSTPPSPVSA